MYRFGLFVTMCVLVVLAATSCATHKSPSAAALPASLAQLRPGGAAGPIVLQPPAATPERKTERSFTGGLVPQFLDPAEAEADTDGDHDREEARDADDDNPGASEEFLREMRMPGGGPLQPERYFAARRHAEAMRHYSISQGRMVVGRGGLRADSLSAPKDLSSGWVSVGPGNVGGRTRSIVINPVDPKIMYAGSVAGGVWKSTDAGATWAPLTDLVPTDYIGSLAMDPNDPNTIYAGTGESNTYSGDARRGLGILKTTDGGANWTRIPSTANSSFYYINKILITPGGNIYAATSLGVFRSSDGGVT